MPVSERAREKVWGGDQLSIVVDAVQQGMWETLLVLFDYARDIVIESACGFDLMGKSRGWGQKDMVRRFGARTHPFLLSSPIWPTLGSPCRPPELTDDHL